MRALKPKVLLVVAALLLGACGDAPLASLGNRSAEWVTDPTIVTTTTVATTVPLVARASNPIWFNDGLGPAEPDPETVVALVFARREGDRFIQSSRVEIVAALPGVQFPVRFPPLAEYVTSQLVIENSGEISTDPSAAFGIWTSEPYSSSRSVGQMMIIRVYQDAETAAEIVAPGADRSCTRFSDATADTCAVEEVAGRVTWVLENASGATLIFFDDQYRYELFGRPFASLEALRQTAASLTPLAEIEVDPPEPTT